MGTFYGDYFCPRLIHLIVTLTWENCGKGLLWEEFFEKGWDSWAKLFGRCFGKSSEVNWALLWVWFGISTYSNWVWSLFIFQQLKYNLESREMDLCSWAWESIIEVIFAHLTTILFIKNQKFENRCPNAIKDT